MQANKEAQLVQNFIRSIGKTSDDKNKTSKYESNHNRRGKRKDGTVKTEIDGSGKKNQSEESKHVGDELTNSKNTSTDGDLEDHDSPGREYESIHNAAHLLGEVKQIRDEFNILKYLLRHQKRVWTELFLNDKSTDRYRGPDYEIEEIEDLDKVAQGIQNSVNDQYRSCPY